MTESLSVAPRQRFLAALTYRNFRYYWTATLLASAGKWMEVVVFSWLALEMTGSPFLVGIVSACRGIGFGLGPLFGTLADRYNRRNLLVLNSSWSALYSLALALLVTTNMIQYWHMIIVALAAGMAHGFDLPLRYTFVGDLVDKPTLTNAVALNTVATDLTAIIGPAIAGPLTNVIGLSGVTWVLTTIYGLNILVLGILGGVATTRNLLQGSVSGNVKTGIRYVLSNPPIFALIVMAVSFNFFQYPQRYTLIPVFAKDVLNVGAAGFGFILAASGFGALVGAALVAYLGDFRRKAMWCIVASVSAGVFVCIFYLLPWYPLSLGIISWVGFAEAVSMTTMVSLLLLLTPVDMRGRVMGIRSLAVLPLSLGSLMSGAIAGQFGAPAAGIFNAFLQVAAILTVAIAVPGLRRSG